MSEPSVASLPPRGRSGPLAALLGLFSSVWFGITLMSLIFVYCFVASAGLLHPVDWSNPFGPWNRWIVRESFNMTEMEVFAWWPFTLLIGLFVINMVVVTVRRIPLTVLSVGVWTIHTGIIILALGSLYYFRTKLEGDTPVFRRHIVLQVPGVPEPQRLIVRPKNRTVVQSPAGPYRFEIQEINPAWPLLSGEDKGKTACSVNVAVTTPTQSFIRQMLIGYPEYLEDILPGKGRAIKAIGKKLVDENLQMAFAYEPQDYFYLKETTALYLRELGSRQWIERPIEWLPHYTTHIADLTEVWPAAGDRPLEPRPLNLGVPAVDPQDPLASADLRITARLHYTDGFDTTHDSWGSGFNPFVNVRLTDSDGSDNIPLLALDPAQRTARNGQLAFAWATSAEERESLAAEAGTLLNIAVPSSNFRTSVPIDEAKLNDQSPDAPFEPLGETGWSYRLRGMMRDLQVKSGTISILIVEFRNAERTLTRWVANDPAATRDVGAEHAVGAFDPVIEAAFLPRPLVLVIGGPGPADVTVVVGSAANRMQPKIGQAVPLGENMSLTVTELSANARRDTRPVLVPKAEQNPDAGEQLSMIKLAVQMGGWSDSYWLPFHRYPLPDPQYAIPGRFRYAPTVLTLPDGRRVEVLLSRKRWPLPAAVALEDFELKTHVGGFVPGNTTSVRDFVSVLRSFRNGAWSDTFTCSLNKPASESGMYYFQAEWDPGEMAFTGLGVGNRQGVYIQLVGCAISVVGMIWVFYVKPYIKRRRRIAVWDDVAAQKQRPAAEPVGV